MKHTELLSLAAPGAVVVRVPEASVIAMIASCAEQIRKAQTIGDALEVANIADAIAAVAKKVAVAKEVKRSAVRLLIEAEAKLGEITRMIPRAKPRHGHESLTKRDILEQNGVSKSRANFAERLASMPRAKIERVVESGASTKHAIFSKLGLHTDNYVLREKKASSIAFLCEEAIGLLDRSVRKNQVPHAGTVAEMRQRYRILTAHGNTAR